MLSRHLQLALVLLTSIELISQSFFTPVTSVKAQGKEISRPPIHDWLIADSRTPTEYLCKCINKTTGNIEPEGDFTVKPNDSFDLMCWRGNRSIGKYQCQTKIAKETAECSAALKVAQEKIKDGKDVTITLVEKYSIVFAHDYESYPKDRPSKYLFGLDGPAAGSIMSSPKFLNAISTDIIKKCRSVSIVDFNRYRTDWNVTFGLTEQGKVKEFTQCGRYAGDQLPSGIPWGSIVC